MFLCEVNDAYDILLLIFCFVWAHINVNEGKHSLNTQSWINKRDSNVTGEGRKGKQAFFYQDGEKYNLDMNIKVEGN